jgi:hypothetical protein
MDCLSGIAALASRRLRTYAADEENATGRFVRLRRGARRHPHHRA